MESQVKIRFYQFTLKKKKDGTTPIYVRITYNYEVVQISTGISVKEREWNKKLMRVRGESDQSKVYNDTLQSLELRVRMAVNQLLKEGKHVSVDRIKNEVLKESKAPVSISTCLNEYVSYIESLLNRDYTPASLERYRYTQKRVMEFIRIRYKKSDFLVEDLNNNFLSDFEVYLKTVIGNSQKTIQKHIQRVSTMIRYSHKRQIVSQFPFTDFKVKVPHKQVEYLTQREIDIVEKKQIFNDRLATIRDLFIFSVYSGLSFREMKNLHRRNLKEINGEYWIDMIRQKTKRQYIVPLLPKCVEIIERYSQHPKRIQDGLLLPLPSNQKFNAYLKEIQDICQIDTVLTCHLARRTFGSTILLQNNVNIHVISQLMGHSNTSVTIKSYLGTDTQMMVNEFGRIKDIYSK